jgi:hypothetical protein
MSRNNTALVLNRTAVISALIVIDVDVGELGGEVGEGAAGGGDFSAKNGSGSGRGR